jgi:IclR family KDG regulon transcriptional repressor
MKTLQKATKVLELFLSDKAEWSLSELSEMSGLHKASINRIVSFLVKAGYLNQRGRRGKYSLGMKFLDFSGVIKNRISIREIAMPYLTKLGQQFEESVFMAVCNGEKAVLIETIHSSQLLRAVQVEGAILSLHSTAAGKLFLAGMTEEGLERYCNSTGLERHTPYTITNLDDLKTQLRIIEKEGVAIDEEEHVIGVSCVAAGIKDSMGRLVGAIGVIGPTTRLANERLREVKQVVKTYGLEISRKLSWRGD